MDSAELFDALVQWRRDLASSRDRGLEATTLHHGEHLLLEDFFEAAQQHVPARYPIHRLLTFPYPADAAAGNPLTVDQAYRMIGRVLIAIHRRYPSLSLPLDMVAAAPPAPLEGGGRPPERDDDFEGPPIAPRYRPAPKSVLDSPTSAIWS
jgi:hypothetical protein